ncbi:hypothetical protein HY68_36685 [Streptomyces sp. AcH 505]|uniref:hypothetical protein n=1 Tax=Streptomyces sp. AcH 505 TaxID=352211 RepID=UPI0005919969|nr:hypothetical protein HY68_36685 [Streptomyces sp. AcH 505]
MTDTTPASPLTPEREQEIRTAVAVYQDHPTIGFSCCSAHAPADAVPALLAELDRIRASRAEMTRSNADWLDGIGQDHAAAMLRYSLDLDAEMAGVPAGPDAPQPTE